MDENSSDISFIELELMMEWKDNWFERIRRTDQCRFLIKCKDLITTYNWEKHSSRILKSHFNFSGSCELAYEVIPKICDFTFSLHLTQNGSIAELSTCNWLGIYSMCNGRGDRIDQVLNPGPLNYRSGALLSKVPVSGTSDPLV